MFWCPCCLICNITFVHCLLTNLLYPECIDLTVCVNVPLKMFVLCFHWWWICFILLVTGIQLMFAHLENHMQIWLVILFLSRQKFHAKDIFVLSSSLWNWAQVGDVRFLGWGGLVCVTVGVHYFLLTQLTSITTPAGGAFTDVIGAVVNTLSSVLAWVAHTQVNSCSYETEGGSQVNVRNN